MRLLSGGKSRVPMRADVAMDSGDTVALMALVALVGGVGM